MSNFAIVQSSIMAQKPGLKFPDDVADNGGVEARLPNLTVVWMYQGRDPENRRKAIAELDYPQVSVIKPEAAHLLEHLPGLMAPDSEICMFWADDDKPVSPDFLRQMVEPLVAEGSLRAAMHLWSGNAVAMPRSALEAVQTGDFQILGNSFMKLALLFLDVGSAAQGARTHVAFSSTERLAPMCADPVGRVS
jgi:hypothetical protein